MTDLPSDDDRSELEIDDLEELDDDELSASRDPLANPLADIFGGGMPDLGSMLDGLNAVQSIQGATYTGTAGGGLVRIVANGRMDVQSVEISPEALGDEPDAELLADLVHAALRDLTGQIADAQQQAMGPLGDILGQ